MLVLGGVSKNVQICPVSKNEMDLRSNLWYIADIVGGPKGEQMSGRTDGLPAIFHNRCVWDLAISGSFRAVSRLWKLKQKGIGIFFMNVGIPSEDFKERFRNIVSACFERKGSASFPMNSLFNMNCTLYLKHQIYQRDSQGNIPFGLNNLLRTRQKTLKGNR